MSIFLVCRQNGSQTVKNFDCYSKFLISHLRGRTPMPKCDFNKVEKHLY